MKQLPCARLVGYGDKEDNKSLFLFSRRSQSGERGINQLFRYNLRDAVVRAEATPAGEGRRGREGGDGLAGPVEDFPEAWRGSWRDRRKAINNNMLCFFRPYYVLVPSQMCPLI